MQLPSFVGLTHLQLDTPPARRSGSRLGRTPNYIFSNGVAMLLVVSLFSITNREARELFIRSLSRGGSWQNTAFHIAPQLISLEVFEHLDDGSDSLCLCLDLWKSKEAYYCACHSSQVQSLLLARRRLADSSFELGAFTFASTSEIQETAASCLN
jgi:hypothetical protein